MRMVLLVGALIVLATGPAVQGQNLARAAPENTEVLELMPDFLVRRIVLDDFQSALDKLVVGGEVERGIAVAAKAWPSMPLTVCFWGGPRDVRRRIVEVAAEWELHETGISFDFGDRNNPQLCDGRQFHQIRVGYSLPGYWSFIGQDSIVHASQTEPSLNLQGFDRGQVSNTEFRRVVLHEFGHALGYRHEHQNPSQVCQFEWPAIYAYLSGPPNNWLPETIDHNMRVLPYLRGDIVGPFDVESIMLYSFPAAFYVGGSSNPCFTDTNTSISDGDIQLASVLYNGNSQQSPAQAVSSIRSAFADSSPNMNEQEKAVIESRLQLLEASPMQQAEILGRVRAEYVDVDLFACSPESSALFSKMTEVVASEPYIGRLRSRSESFPDDLPLQKGINVVVDIDHPESRDGDRLLGALRQAFPDQVSIVPNQIEASPWYISIVACDR